MATWFECKFKYNREDQNGGFTTVTEIYLIDAVSFTDAEARVYEEIGSNFREFVLLAVSKYRVHELVFNEEGLTWYKCKVAITSLDEKSGKEKKLKQMILVNGNTIKEAYDRVEDLFSDSTSDYQILEIITTNIVEILPYHEPEPNLKPLAQALAEANTGIEPEVAAEIETAVQSSEE
jgi:DNA repair ATPase RecN